MKKLIALTFCMMMSVATIAYGQEMRVASIATTQNNENGIPDNNEEMIGMPNPFKDCTTLQEASNIAGFEISVPDQIDGYADKTIMAVDKEMIQVIYGNEEKVSNKTEEELNHINWQKVDFVPDNLMIRKALGNEDISGDYNPYSEIHVVSIEGLQVTTKGNDGKVNVAIWTDNGYTFAITANNSMSNKTVYELVKNVK